MRRKACGRKVSCNDLLVIGALPEGVMEVDLSSSRVWKLLLLA